MVDSIECSVACGEYGTLTQSLEVPAGFTGDAEAAAAGGTEQVSLEGGPEPQTITRSYGFTEADYDLTVNREGGGSLEMALSIPVADEEVVTEDAILEFLGGDAERTEEDGTAVYTRTAEAKTAEELPGELQALGLEGVEGPPQVEVYESGKKNYEVTVVMGVGGDLSEKILGPGTWTVEGDGLRPTSLVDDQSGSASLGEDAIVVKQSHGVWMTFTAERTGLSTVTIVLILAGLAVLGLLVAAGVVGFLHREKIAGLLRGAETDVPDSSSGSSGPSF